MTTDAQTFDREILAIAQQRRWGKIPATLMPHGLTAHVSASYTWTELTLKAHDTTVLTVTEFSNGEKKVFTPLTTPAGRKTLMRLLQHLASLPLPEEKNADAALEHLHF